MYSRSVAETTSQSRSSTSCGRLKIASLQLHLVTFMYRSERKKKRREKNKICISWLENGNRGAAEAFAVTFIAIHLSNEGRKQREDVRKAIRGIMGILVKWGKGALASLPVWKVSMKDEWEKLRFNVINVSGRKAYRSVILVTRAFLATWKLSQIAENV